MSVSQSTPSPFQNNSQSHYQLSRPEFENFIQRVNAAIDAETLAKDLFGTMTLNTAMSNSEQLRFGTKGSLCINLKGVREGTWMNYESGKGGNLVQLVQNEKGLDFKSALSYVTPYVRSREVVQQIDDFTQGKKIQKVEKTDKLIDWDEVLKKELKEKDLEKESRQKVDSAKEIIAKTVPLDGTPAENYLKNERCIKGELPDSLRYLPAGTKFHYGDKDRYIREGALAAIATDSEGNQKAVQITYLTKEGKRAETPDGDKFPKISYGVAKGACVELQTGNKTEPVIIAEGVETALSLKEAGVKGGIICSLGTSNMKNLNLQNRDVIIAGDWDGSFDKPSWKATEKAQAELERNGNKVEIILPIKNPEKRPELSPELTNVKVHFNDLLKQGGVKSVIDRVSDRFPEVIGKASSLRDTISEDSHDKQKDTQDSKGKSPFPPAFPGDGLSTDHAKNTSPVLEKMEPKVTSEKVAPSPVTLPKPSPFKTNPFDMKNCANDLGRGR